MNDADFLEVIRANPDDATPQLVYADWLDDRGDPRGELIRLHDEVGTDLLDHPHWKHYLSTVEHVYGTSQLTVLIGLLDGPQQGLLTCQVADSVLHYYETLYPKDKRLRQAIKVSRAAALRTPASKKLRTAFAAVEAAIQSAWADAFKNCGGRTFISEWSVSLTAEQVAAKQAIRAALAVQKTIGGAWTNETFIAQNASMHAAKTAADEASYGMIEAKHLTWVVNRLLGLNSERE